jgi:hypothetical protein
MISIQDNHLFSYFFQQKPSFCAQIYPIKEEQIQFPQLFFSVKTNLKVSILEPFPTELTSGPDRKFISKLFENFGISTSQNGTIGLLRDFFLFLHPNGIACLMDELVESRRKIIKLRFEHLIEVMKKDEEMNPKQYTREKFQSFYETKQERRIEIKNNE